MATFAPFCTSNLAIPCVAEVVAVIRIAAVVGGDGRTVVVAVCMRQASAMVSTADLTRV